jgi:3-dehydroquinate synthase
MLQFYHNFKSPYSRCVWMVIQAKKITVELIRTDAKQKNCFDYIPIIVDDGWEIRDTLAILDYLEAQYPYPTLLTQDVKALATVRMVENMSINYLLPAIAFWRSKVKDLDKETLNREQKNTIASVNSDCLQIKQNEQQILSILTFLKNLLQQNNYFGGDQITLAEVTAGSAIALLPNVDSTLAQFPLLKAWLLRVTKWSAWLGTQPFELNEVKRMTYGEVSLTQCPYQPTQILPLPKGVKKIRLSTQMANLNQPHKINCKSEPEANLATINQTFSVDFNYQVHFTKNFLALDNPLLAEIIATAAQQLPQKAIAVVDAGLLIHYPQLLTQIKNYACQYSDLFSLEVEPLVVLAGEAVKNDPQLIDLIHSTIQQAGICRHSYILSIGGGAVLDMVGYAAATAHRGIRLIRIPTTVLSQNDSAVGVKNSINAFGKKNFLGTFAPPHAVINDLEFLTTLEDRDWRSGVAEAIKVALIKDANFFTLIATEARKIVERNLDTMSQVIYRCAQLHLEHIATSGDPFESGSSRPLDFGHWAAHRLEYLTNYRLRHGEAVAIGIALDCTYSYLQQLLPYSQWEQILTTLTTLGFNLYVPELASQEKPHSLFQGLEEFREHLGGELTLTLLKQIGKGIEVHQVDISLYEQAVSELKEFVELGQKVEEVVIPI